MTLELHFSARSHVGMVRKGNEDSGYASSHLIVIADGMGGHAAGEVASTAALKAFLDDLPTDPAEPDVALRDGVAVAGRRLREMIRDQPELEGMGTTLTALLQVGDRVAIAQVGDSRGYLLRDGVLEQITHDQTFVQSLVDQGRISHDAARTHPQRSLLLQALDGRVEVEPVIAVRSPQVGDRYLLCSDGLSGVLAEATMREVLMVGSPDEAVAQLIDLALRGGAPDNVTCVVADVAETDDGGPADDQPVLVGAAAEAAAESAAGTDGAGRSGGTRVATAAGSADSAAAGDGEPGEGRHRRPRGFRLLLPLLIVVVLVGVAAIFGYRWTQTQYFVGSDSGQVAIYRGVPQHLVGRSLSTVVESSDIKLEALPTFARDQVDSTIQAPSLAEAHAILARLQAQAASCTVYPEPDGCPPGLATAPPPSLTPSPTASPSPSPSHT